MSNNAIVLGFPEYDAPAYRLATACNCAYAQINIHRFPDDESLVTLPTPLPRHVIFCRSLDHPNNKLIELMLAAKTARKLGATRLTLVAPYLCYMRQDQENHPGEAISQQVIGPWLADLFDDVITVDPHLHRISRLEQAIPTRNAISITAAPVIANFLKTKFTSALLFGPDGESLQWVKGIADTIGFDYAVANKVRLGDTQVNITLPDINVHDKTVVMIDDVASTGRTIANATSLLLAAGAREVHTIVTHALFTGDAEQKLLQSGVKSIWSTDSIAHDSNTMTLDKLLGDELKALFR